MSHSTAVTVRRPGRRAAALVSATAAVAGSLTLAAPNAPAHAATPVFPASTSARIPQGWTAVETGTPNGNGESLVYAVAPNGAQRLVLHLRHYETVADVSGDGRRVLTTDGTNGGYRVRLYDLATHRQTLLPQKAVVARFTNPTGLNVLLPLMGRNQPVVRVSLTGKVLARFPAATDISYAPTTDGRYLWGSVNQHITLSDNATGRVVRRYAIPKGYAGCMVSHDWNASGVVASCYKTTGSYAQAFLFKVAGGAATNLTGGLPNRDGYDDAWYSPAGLAANETSQCGPTPTVLKTGSRVRLIPITAVTNVMGSSAYGYDTLTCGDTPRVSYVRVDLPSMRIHRLLTPGTGRTFMGVVQNDPRRGSTN